MKPNIGISDGHLLEITKRLNILLSDEFALYAKTRNYHWNVTGQSFSEMHLFFESQYEQLDDMMDEVAERIRMLGHYSLGSLNAFAKATRLLEGDDESTTLKKVQNLLDDHETVIRELRNDINAVIDTYKDQGTGDFLTGIMKQHEKMAWMLRVYLE